MASSQPPKEETASRSAAGTASLRDKASESQRYLPKARHDELTVPGAIQRI